MGDGNLPVELGSHLEADLDWFERREETLVSEWLNPYRTGELIWLRLTAHSARQVCWVEDRGVWVSPDGFFVGRDKAFVGALFKPDGSAA